MVTRSPARTRMRLRRSRPARWGKHNAVVFKLDAEQAARKLLQHNSSDFYVIFFTHSTLPFFGPAIR